MIFDGKVDVLSTCQLCDTQMKMISIGVTVHPCCDPNAAFMPNQFAVSWFSSVMAGNFDAARRAANRLYGPGVPDLQSIALGYAAYGWPVFPLRPMGTTCDGGKECETLCRCPKKPATPKGFHAATTSTEKINQWWNAHPDSNIGLATGHVFDVIDLDLIDGFLEILEAQDVPPVHGIAATSSGGVHLYVDVTGSANRRAMKPGMDFRGKGGYVVAPHSILTQGHRWSWIVQPSPSIKQDF